MFLFNFLLFTLFFLQLQDHGQTELKVQNIRELIYVLFKFGAVYARTKTGINIHGKMTSLVTRRAEYGIFPVNRVQNHITCLCKPTCENQDCAAFFRNVLCFLLLFYYCLSFPFFFLFNVRTTICYEKTWYFNKYMAITYKKKLINIFAVVKSLLDSDRLQ